MAVNTRIANRRGMVPIGTIIAFYDFGAVGAGFPLTFDTKTWKYCDGTNVVDADSPLNGQTTPDLSNRYLVGLGTENSKNIGTTGWVTAPVGAASHSITLTAAQSGQPAIPAGSTGAESHTHSTANFSGATASSGSHSHFLYDGEKGNTYGNTGGSGRVEWSTDDTSSLNRNVALSSGSHTHSKGTLSIVSSGSHSHTIAAVAAANAADAHSIQPRSIRVRFIMRIA